MGLTLLLSASDLQFDDR